MSVEEKGVSSNRLPLLYDMNAASLCNLCVIYKFVPSIPIWYAASVFQFWRLWMHAELHYPRQRGIIRAIYLFRTP